MTIKPPACRYTGRPAPDKTNTCYCFSANCATHGKSLADGRPDVIDFIMYKESGTCPPTGAKHQAILKAKQLIGAEIPSGAKEATTVAITSTTPATSANGADLADGRPTRISSASSRTSVLSKMFGYFSKAIYNSTPAKDYLQSRGLSLLELEQAGIAVGYNSGQFHHGSRRNEQLIASCIEHGLLSPFGSKSRVGGQAYQAFGKSSLAFALRNKSGHVSGLYFRSILADTQAKHYYLRNRQGLYPHYPAAESKKLLLTESIIDAASLLQQESLRQQYSVLALYGTNGLTAEHRSAIAALEQLEEVVFFFDGDAAGRAAAAKYHKVLEKEGLQLTHVPTPEGQDINSLITSHEQGVLAHLLEQRKATPPVVEAFSTDVFLSNDGRPADGRPNENPIERKSPTKGSASRLDTAHPHKLVFTGSAARYTVVGGLGKSPDSLKVTLHIQHKSTKSRHKLDLYEDKLTERASREAAAKLALPTEELQHELEQLTDLLEDHREQQLTAPAETAAPVLALTAK